MLDHAEFDSFLWVDPFESTHFLKPYYIILYCIVLYYIIFIKPSFFKERQTQHMKALMKVNEGCRFLGILDILDTMDSMDHSFDSHRSQALSLAAVMSRTVGEQKCHIGKGESC